MPTQQVVFDPARLNDFELVAEVGEPLSDEGLTRVNLSGNGRLTVEQQHGEKKGEQFSSEINRERAENVFRQVSQFDWGQRFPLRRGLPDEAIIQWYFNDRHGDTMTLKVWLRDAEKHGVMASVLAALRESVDRITGGKLYL
jgi:hypothetical protein